MNRPLLFLHICLLVTLTACVPQEEIDPLRNATEAVKSSTLTPSPTHTPTIIPTPTPLACWGEGGHIVPGEIDSDYVRDPLAFLVYFPPCYGQETNRTYPVLYLIHGQSFNQDQWDRLGADDVADALIAAGEISPFIIVMPQVIDWAEPPDSEFGLAMKEDLIPYIDETYRTITERDYRAVGGLSRGASWAIHLGLHYWEMFGTIGLHSLPIFWSDSKLVRGWLVDIPEESFPRIYVDIADRDLDSIRHSANWFINELETNSLPHEFFIYPGIHNEEYWGAHVEEYIRFYAGEW